MQYNGWTNYETWQAKLRIDDDDGSYSRWKSEARDVLSLSDGDRDAASAMLAERLKAHFDGRAGEFTRGEASLTPRSGEVNWHEIAEALLGVVDPFCRFT